MAIVATNLTHGHGTNATSFNTASITPAANALIVVSVASRTSIGAGTTPNTPTVTGDSLTFVSDTNGNIEYDNTSSSRKKASINRSMSASPSSGVLTIDFAGQTQTDCSWSVDQYTGTDTSGTNGSGAIVQTNQNSSPVTAVTSLTVALSAFGSTNNVGHGVFASSNDSSAMTAGTGFTQLATENLAATGATNLWFMTEYKLNDPNVLTTFASQPEVGGVAIEIKASTTVASVANGMMTPNTFFWGT